MKRIILCIICTFIAAITFSSCRNSADSKTKVPDIVLGEELSNELNTPCSEEDRAELQPILDDVEKAFSTVVGRIPKPETAKEEHSIEFLTGKIDCDNAYMWFSYWKKEYDSDGTLTYTVGSEEEPLKSRLTAEKQNGEWIVTGAVDYESDLIGK